MDIGIILALVLAVAAIVIAGIALARQAQDRRTLLRLTRRTAVIAHASKDVVETGDGPRAAERVAVVINPSKHDDPQRYRETVRTAIERFEGSQAAFYETTKDDPGYGQAKQAVADGADLVIAAGGDGTVRMVASALANTDTRMAIIPAGTGNLLARNLEIPLEDVEGAIRVATQGDDKSIDVGWIRTGDTPHDVEIAERKIFLVMAGFGADAEIIGAANPTMKKRIGWMAYVVGGVSKVVGRSHEVEITLPGEIVRVVKARTVLIGNVGKLPGGIVLMPDATIDNGRLEILALSWRSAAGLSQIIAQLVAPSLKRSPFQPKISTMERYLVSTVGLVAGKPQPVQFDGDMEESASRILAEIDPGALKIRVPAAKR